MITTADFIGTLKVISPDIEVLGQYTKAKEHIHCKCKKCGYEWDSYPSSLLKGHGCKKCADAAKRGRKKKTSLT